MASVDHAERKRLIAEKARAIIAAEGLDAATIRRIAAELDFSTHAITHYFADKDELLLWTYEALDTEGFALFSGVARRDPGDLVGCLMAMTATDPVNVRLWRVYIAFWDRAGRDPRFAAAQRHSIRKAEDLLAGTIARRNPRIADPVRCARQMIAMVNGISVQALLDPGCWTAQTARAAYEGYAGSLLEPLAPAI
jgi:AcrR family transcriptional regulator